MRLRTFHLILLVFLLFTSNPTFTQAPPSTENLDVNTQAVVAERNDNDLKYKIVLAASKGGPEKWISNDQIKKGLWGQVRELRDRVNGVTASGYRLKSVIIPMALVAQDPAGYQYDFFDERSAGMNLLGFRLFAHFLLGSECGYYGTGSSDSDPQQLYCSEITTDGYEQPLNTKDKVEQFIVDRMAAPNSHPARFMAAEINRKFREGFYPSRIYSKFGIILEKGPEPEFARYDPEFEVLREGSDLEKKVNVLAKQGYRVLMTESGIAVLYRNDKTRGIPVTYHWIDGSKPDLGEKIAKLEQAGARYCAVASSERGIRKFLVFEQPAQTPARPSEFKILDLATELRMDPVDRQTYLDLTDNAKRSVAEMNKLATEGFAVRDLFQSDKVAVLLERMP